MIENVKTIERQQQTNHTGSKSPENDNLTRDSAAISGDWSSEGQIAYERELFSYLIARAYLIAICESIVRVRERENVCELRLCERERDRNFYFRFSPEVKIETEPKLRFG